MSFEDAADLAGFFDTDDFAVSAIWRAGGTGDPVTVPVLPARADSTVEIYGHRASSATGRFLVRVSDIADPQAGDSLTVDAVAWTVQGAPERDDTRSVWRLEAVEG